jgi:hypothetical protein
VNGITCVGIEGDVTLPKVDSPGGWAGLAQSKFSEAVNWDGGVGDDVEGALADEVGVGLDGAGGAVVDKSGAAG